MTETAAQGTEKQRQLLSAIHRLTTAVGAHKPILHVKSHDEGTKPDPKEPVEPALRLVLHTDKLHGDPSMFMSGLKRGLESQGLSVRSLDPGTLHETIPRSLSVHIPAEEAGKRGHVFTIAPPRKFTGRYGLRVTSNRFLGKPPEEMASLAWKVTEDRLGARIELTSPSTEHGRRLRPKQRH